MSSRSTASTRSSPRIQPSIPVRSSRSDSGSADRPAATPSGALIIRQKSSWLSESFIIYLFLDASRMLGLGGDLGKLRDVIVALDQCRQRTESPYRRGVEPPHRVDDRVIVRVEE